jgi:uracil phosphoribosyltransferase
MGRDTTIGELLALLKSEITDRKALVDKLESMVGAEPPTRTKGLALAAVEILRAAGRPMHGLHEILPALQARGFVLRSRAGFATTLLRTGQVRRTAPGTFAYAGGADAGT